MTASTGPVLSAAQLTVLGRYGAEHDTALGEVLYADGDEIYDLIVMLAGAEAMPRALLGVCVT